MYIRPFTTSRMITLRLPPPVLPGGISGSTSPHSSSVRSLGYRNLLRSYRPRFLLVHIGDPSSNQATTLESQMIHMIQELFGQTVRHSSIVRMLLNGVPVRVVASHHDTSVAMIEKHYSRYITGDPSDALTRRTLLSLDAPAAAASSN